MRRENHKHMATWLWLESRAQLKLKILHWLILSSWPRGKTIWLLNILHVFKCLQGCLKLLAGLRTTSMRGSTNQSSMASDSVPTNLPVWLWSSLFDKTTSSHKKVAQLLPASQVLSLQDMNRKDDYPLFLRHINNMAGGSDSIAVCFAYICLLLMLPLWSLFSLSLGPKVDKHANSVLACVKSTGKKIKCAHSNTLSISTSNLLMQVKHSLRMSKPLSGQIRPYSREKMLKNRCIWLKGHATISHMFWRTVWKFMDVCTISLVRKMTRTSWHDRFREGLAKKDMSWSSAYKSSLQKVKG